MERADKFRDIEGKIKGEAIVMELNVWLYNCNKGWMFSQPPTYREQVTRKHCERECVCSYEYATIKESIESCFISMLSGLDLPKASPAPELTQSLTHYSKTHLSIFPSLSVPYAHSDSLAHPRIQYSSFSACSLPGVSFSPCRRVASTFFYPGSGLLTSLAALLTSMCLGS
jgi:hypothetical protein